MDNLKNLISAILEGILGMFVGIFKHAFRIIKEGIKIMMQSYSVLFGENANKSTPAEKGDAILKIFGVFGLILCSKNYLSYPKVYEDLYQRCFLG